MISIEQHARALEYEKDKLAACLTQEKDRYDALDRKYNDILLSGGANKLSHFSKIKEQNNQCTKQVLQLTAELQAKQRELERQQSATNTSLTRFGDFLLY